MEAFLIGLTIGILAALWGISIDGKPLWKIIYDKIIQ